MVKKVVIVFGCGYTRVSSEFKKESYEDRYEYSIEMSGE